LVHLERALQSTNSDSEDSKSDADQNEELGSELDEDDEVRNAILTEDEVKLKTQVWMELNGDYLREMEGKYILSIGI
jgi:transcription factor IIIB subunit 2